VTQGNCKTKLKCQGRCNEMRRLRTSVNAAICKVTYAEQTFYSVKK
jgi:hypothetical protein